MKNYSKVAEKLALVRGAWRRTAALSGLAVVVLESAGVFTIALLADALYRPLPSMRTGLFLVALGIVLYLLARHVLSVILRKIPDEQIALYVEEHSPEFEGALMSAAEFGPEEALPPEQAKIIDAIIAAAASRAERFDLRSAIDLSRLRKYGVAAGVVLAGYIMLGVAFPTTVGHHAGRLLRPWKATAEDQRLREHKKLMKTPLEFALSRENSRILRGSAFDLEVGLSRPSEAPIVLLFRSVVDEYAEDWRLIPMEEIEKLNTYRIVLPDVNEDLEFYVGSGDDRSGAYHITVYDPLVLEGVEVTTHFPGYLKLSDRVETLANGDVAAPIGSEVTVCVLTNRPLAQGKLTWDDGKEQKLTIGTGDRTTASATFKVEEDTTYTYQVLDIDNQEAESPGAAYVRALGDGPPSLELKYPKIDIATHPLGETTFEAEAGDDFGIEAVELVYTRGTEEDAPELRAALELQAPEGEEGESRPGITQARLRFAFEELKPEVQPGDHFSYHLECRDRKGQTAISDVFFITVTPFEVWSTWNPKEGEEEGGVEIKVDLRPFLAAAWHLHRQKDVLAEDQYGAQCEELADSMTDPETGQVYPFVDLAHIPADKMTNAKRALRYINKGHRALLGHDTGTTVSAFRVALAELALVGLSDDDELLATPESTMAMAADEERSLAQIAFLEDAKTAGETAGTVEMPMPDYRRELLEAEEAERLQEKAQQLAQAQQEIIEEAQELEREQQAEGQEQTAEAQQDQQAREQLAQKQEQAAEATRQAAEELKTHRAAEDPRLQKMGEKVERAAREMHRAAREMRDNEMQRAVASAQKAKQELEEAQEELKGIQQEKLERALDLAETHAERLLQDQQKVRQDTEQVARQLPPEKKPDARQERDLRKLALQEAELEAGAEKLQEHVAHLLKWADRTSRRETGKHIEQANKNILRNQIRQKMVNAVFELDTGKPEKATPHQKKAEEGLKKVLDNVRDASDSLASDRESELRRASREARRVEEQLEKLDEDREAAEGKPESEEEAEGEAETAQAQDRDQEETGEARPEHQRREQRQDAEDAQTAQAQPSAEGETRPEPRRGEQEQEQERQQAQKPKPRPLTPEQRRALAESAAYDMKRLAKHVADREFAGKKDSDYLKEQAEKPREFGAAVSIHEEKRKEVLEVVRRVRNKLEDELESTLKAKKLFSAQREECPPQYRPMVNKYYEALSNAGK